MKALDFETHGIESRPFYPPEPVGLAYLGDGESKGQYLPWGHPAQNHKGAKRAATALLKVAFRTEDVVFHNCAFDLAVAFEKLLVPLPDGERINDTMFLAFLADPYGELGLKPLAERYLGVPPAERDAVRDWLYASGTIKANVRKWGAHIAKAPGELVGRYAAGDVSRTIALYEHLAPLVKQAGMWPAYRRECELVPMLLENSAAGIPLDEARLRKDCARFEVILADVEKALRRRWLQDIGSNPPVNFDSNDELADSLEAGGVVLPSTATGKRSVAKGTLEESIPDCQTKGLLLYRSAIEKSLSTYLRPWLEQGAALHCNWNQVRDYSDAGARTGRLSSSPNLQNITTPEKYGELAEKMKSWGVPASKIEFPNLRSYIAAPKGYELFSLDYSQQELRMLAHFEDDVLAKAYNENPKLDLHQFVADMIKTETGVAVTRKHTKTINFAKVYGAGTAKISAQLGVDIETGETLLRAYDRALPSVRALQADTSNIGKRGQFIRTLGGRRYFAEPPQVVNGMQRSFEYKLLNYLIQGSSADQTKEAMRQWWGHLKGSGDARFLLTVHDELVGIAPKDKVRKEADVLDECMRDAFKLDVPMLTDAEFGPNLGELK